MARLWDTGFEHGDLDLEFDYRADQNAVETLSQTDGVRTGDYSYQIALTAGAVGDHYGYGAVVLDETDEIYVRTAFTITESPSNEDGVYATYLAFCDGDGDVQFSLGHTANTLRPLILSGYGGLLGYGGTALGTASMVLRQYQTNLVECHYKLHDSAGTCTVRINGIQVFDYGGQTRYAGGTAIEVVRFGYQREAAPVEYQFVIQHDDCAINDTSGSIQAGWPGAGGILFLPPVDYGSKTNWIASTGGADQWAMVDEIPADGTATYNYSSGTVADTIDLFEIQDLPSDVDEVVLLWITHQSMLATAGSAQIGGQYLSGTVESTSGTQILTNTTAELHREGPIYLDPNTAGSAWTPASVNAMEAGYTTL